MTTPDASEDSQRRRSPVSREEGSRRMVDATIELLRTRRVGDVSVHDIADASDMNHGLVHRWFGSKTGLLLAAFSELTRRVAERIDIVGGQMVTDDDVVLTAKLFAWLVLDGNPPPEGLGPQPIRRRITEMAVNTWGLDERTAAVVANQAVSITLTIALFGEALGLEQRLDESIALWLRSVELLARDRATPGEA